MEKYFGNKLKQLLRYANVKNATLAKSLEYDVSYISKWVNSQSLPSDKNLDKTIEKISLCICEGESDKLLEFYHCDESDLSACIKNDLLNEYRKCRSGSGLDNFEYNIHLNELLDIINNKMADSYKTTAVIDLFSMNNEERLKIAGIKDGNFVEKEINGPYDMVIDVSNSKDCVYDSIFLIHMLTGLSNVKYKLYNHKGASGKFLYLMDHTAVYSVMFNGENVSASSVNRNLERMKNYINTFTIQNNLIFRNSTIKQMIDNLEYSQSVISTNVKWVLGHVTELILPKDVYDEVLDKYVDDKIETYQNLFKLSQNIIKNKNTYIIMYDTAFSNFLITGELDFYNQKVILNNEQRLKCIKYFETLIDNNINFKLIEGGFSDDFKYITNPCVFLSDAICYLRLENKKYEDNIMVLYDRQVKKLFYNFYDEIWNNREDVVLSDKNKILQRLQHYYDVAKAI